MGEKSVRKKEFILEKSKEVFCLKGFKNVTMKDIVEACDISRGGLYLYFESTAQILDEILKAESKENNEEFMKNIAEDSTAADILLLFLQELKKEMLEPKGNLSKAIYEYYSDVKVPKKENLLKRRFDENAKVIQKLIEIGTEEGDFYCEMPKEASIGIMYQMEGMKITALTVGITDEAVDRQIFSILKSLGIE